jgi:hypothetical protein
MTARRPPVYEPRRTAELREELLTRARSWLPDWRPRTGTGELGAAVLGIAARIESEVTQRLDRVPEKVYRNFFAWLGVRGQAGRAARLPVVFSMNAKASALDAPAPVQLQAVAGDVPVVLETEAAVRILPGRIASLVGANPGADEFTVPGHELGPLEAPRPLPNEWRLESPASPGATRLQLGPALGLVPGLTLEEDGTGLQHRVTAVDGSMVSIEPRLGATDDPDAALVGGERGDSDTVFRRVGAFGPFSPESRNRQEHALYLGAEKALDMDTAGTIEVRAEGELATDAQWSFWGNTDADDTLRWVELEAIQMEAGRSILWKPKGTVERLALHGKSSRWLRGTRRSGAGSVGSSGIALRINCDPGEDEPLAPEANVRLQELKALRDGSVDSSPVLEGVANVAPLVLNAPFYPLGRTPRQFDSFYLASKEAFSKANAKVTLDFKMGDSFDGALSAAHVAAGYLMTAVGTDGRLRRVWSPNPPHPDAPATVTFLTSAEPPSLGGQPVELHKRSRPGAVVVAGTAHFSIAGDHTVYVWRQTSNTDPGFWTPYGEPAKSVDGGRLEDTLLVSTPSGLKCYAVSNETLYVRRIDRDSPWTEVAGLKDVLRIAPVLVVNDDGEPVASVDELLCVREDRRLYHLVGDGPARLLDIRLPDRDEVLAPVVVDADFYPLAVRSGEGPAALTTCAFQATLFARLVAFRIEELPGSSPADPPLVKELRGQALDDRPDYEDAMTFTWSLVAREYVGIAAAFLQESEQFPRMWFPFVADGVVTDEADPGSPAFVNGPVTLGAFHVFPAEQGAAWISTPPVILEANLSAPIRDALVMPAPAKREAKSFFLVQVPSDPAQAIERMSPALTIDEARVAVELAVPPENLAGGASNTFSGSGKSRSVNLSGDRLDIGTKATIAVDDYLYLSSDAESAIAQVVQIVEIRDDKGVVKERHAVLEATGGNLSLAPADPENPPPAKKVQYTPVDAVDPATVDLRTSIDVSQSAATPPMLQHAVVRLRGSQPLEQVVDVVLEETKRALTLGRWMPPPNDGTIRFDVLELGKFGALRLFEPPRPRNPELFWEYWNGTGWWRIPNLIDGTENFVRSALVEFCVPKDLAPVDVLGRNNHWIRARLVGGDFGNETVTIKNTGPDNGTTTQTVIRSNDSIAAPYVIELGAKYSVCCPVSPDYVLTLDSGSLRDQTDANRSPGAVVRHFVLLSETLDAFQAPGAGDPTRAIYLGFDTKLSGGPIALLFLLEEGNHDAAFPLRVEALSRGSFRPVVAEDGTRGLNETGIVSFSLSESPELTELFGQARYWIRLRPGALLTDEESWTPHIHAAYLNAAWAVAAETIELELLGSSDGSPGQRATLARPPVLEQSLELRVLEPLGDEEKAELRAADLDAVLDAVGLREGPWVRWTEVVDPLDHGPDERVFALDHATGTVTFGDGLHGMIPPIGRDAFMARRYKALPKAQQVAPESAAAANGAGASSPGGPVANRVVAWSPIGLVTPLAGVEAAVAPTDAAGASDPQDAATTLRFAPANLRLGAVRASTEPPSEAGATREGALTLRDLELLALQFSPEIGQVRALARRGGVALVVAMRGREPLPSQATRRELLAYLLARSGPTLAGRVEVIPPSPLPVRVRVTVSLDSVSWSGVVSREITDRIIALLDPATGGDDGTGWPFGQSPSEADLAARLLDIPHLEALGAVSVESVADEESPVALTASLRPSQMLRVVADEVLVETSLAEDVA